MKLKFIISLIFLLYFKSVYSQLVITEVYYNTPYNEKMSFQNDSGIVSAKKHHWGEFVEIYNISDRDITLKDWYLKDGQGIFWLPADKTIKKGEFMVVAYSSFPSEMTPFTELFSTTAGKDNQIILQDRIILRNKSERISLGRSFNGINLIEKSKYEWNDKDAFNFIANIWQDPAQFYNVNSIQFNPNSTDYEAIPNPLAATYVPPTQSYEDLVRDDFQQNYSYLDWTDNVNDLLNRVCLINIEKVAQSPTGTYDQGSVCFTYDEAGNILAGAGCTSDTGPGSVSQGYSSDELEAIKNSIVISPNPTKASDSYNVTMSWSGPALNKINNIQVSSSVGVIIYGFAPGNGINTTTFNLQNQLQGAFIANFVLNTGQIISKNILKW
ncbi:lamin tail domain-containing protein [Chryseobacterium populi]|uniref:LTD domain-containing protein n=1 Tax=Chryseobacterium populi TaxID=1144316 RepID=J3CEF0_9FLAO|nr:lamin tail domain-containing protein [Chryseobacterium populi]EJL69989.1 hypothetical protein PMI13_02998 [Chryseobacterium populi]